MKREYINLTNGVLTCIEDLGMQKINGKLKHYLKVICSRCGGISIVRADRITAKNYIPHSCTNCVTSLQKEIADNKYLESRHFRKRKFSILGNAKSRGIKVELTNTEIYKILNSSCYYCGKEKADGIDRIDSNKAYTIDNVVPCCGTCNIMKNKFPLDSFLDQIDKIYHKLIHKEGSTTIPKGSTSQANGDGSGKHLEKGDDIV